MQPVCSLVFSSSLPPFLPLSLPLSVPYSFLPPLLPLRLSKAKGEYVSGIATQLTSELEMSRMELTADVGRPLAQALRRVLGFDLSVVQPDWRWQQ